METKTTPITKSVTPTTVHARHTKAIARDVANTAQNQGWTVAVSKSGAVTLKK